MKRVFGRLAFWLGWPVLWVYLRSSARTRLLLVCGEEVLLLRGWIGSGKWALPGGGLKRGEKPEVGLLREVQEEIGVKLNPDDIKPIGDYQAREHGLGYHFYAFVCIVDKKPELQLQQREIRDSWWVNLASVDSVQTDSVVKQVVDGWRARV